MLLLVTQELFYLFFRLLTEARQYQSIIILFFILKFQEFVNIKYRRDFAIAMTLTLHYVLLGLYLKLVQ